MKILSTLFAGALAALFVTFGYFSTADADLIGQTFYPGWYGECVNRADRQRNEVQDSDVCSREESVEVWGSGSYQEECVEESCDTHERLEMLAGESAAEWPTEEGRFWQDVMLVNWCQYGKEVKEGHIFDDWMKHMCFPP